jgi:hypothetical protein
MNPPPPLDDSTWVLYGNTAFPDSSTLTVLFYQRNSVCSYLRASSIQDPMLAHFLSSYQGFSEECRTFSKLSIPDYSFENEPPRTDDTTWRNDRCNTRGDIPANTQVNVGFVRTRANLDPLGFHDLFLACWITLVDRFSLNLLESVSVFIAILLCPNTLEPLARVTLHLLNKRWRPSRGFEFGYDVMVTMSRVRLAV